MSIFTKRNYWKPFDYPWAYDYFKRMRELHWMPAEVVLDEDVRDWKSKLNDFERALLTQAFRFFVQADINVAEGYANHYMKAFPKPEFKALFWSIGDSEANHIDSYSQLIDTVGMPETEYQAFSEYKEMQDKHDYLFIENDTAPSGRKWSKKEKLALNIAKFSAFGEGVQLFSSFAILLSFKNRNLMKGMGTIVEWSIRDETLHVEVMTRIFRTVVQENPELWNDDLKKAIYQMARDMVKLEDRFIDIVFGMGEVEGITAKDVKTYIRAVTDRRLNQLGLKSNYHAKNPLDWIAPLISAQTHTNFFEGRSTEYIKGGILDWENAFAFLDRKRAPLSPEAGASAGLI